MAVSEQSVVVWDIHTERKIARLRAGGGVRIRDISHDGRWLATTSGVTLGASKQLRIWDINAGVDVKIWTDDSVANAKFRPDGLHVVVWSDDGSVAEYDSANGQVISETPNNLMEMVNEIKANGLSTSSTVSHNGQWKLSVSSDDGGYTVRVLNTDTDQEVTRLIEGAVATAVSTDQNRLATISRKGDVKIWVWPPDELITQACSHLPYNMSTDQWKEFNGDVQYRRVCPDLPINTNSTVLE